MSAEIAAVIVTYKNPAGLTGLLGGLAEQSLRPAVVWVIDNAPSDASARAVAASPLKIEYVRMAENAGSAGGYAEGLSRAAATHELIWLLDDDVVLQPDSLAALAQAYARLESGGAQVAVRSWCAQSCPFAQPRETDSFAWRGTLIPRRAIEKTGLPRTDYFLYADDAEYALRMREAGYRIFWIPASRVIERRQEDKVRIRRGRFNLIFYRSPARLYYAFRNQLHLAVSHRRWWLLIRTLGYALKVLALIPASADQPGLLRRAVRQGVADGFRARLGKHEAYLNP